MTSGDPSECMECSYHHPRESKPPQLPLLTGVWAAQHGLVLSPAGNSDACGGGKAFLSVLLALLLLQEYTQFCCSCSGLVEFLLSLRGRSQAWIKSQLAFLESKLFHWGCKQTGWQNGWSWLRCKFKPVFAKDSIHPSLRDRKVKNCGITDWGLGDRPISPLSRNPNVTHHALPVFEPLLPDNHTWDWYN